MFWGLPFETLIKKCRFRYEGGETPVFLLAPWRDVAEMEDQTSY